METSRSKPWYKGTRGEWYVVAQIVLIALVVLGPRGEPTWVFPRTMFGTALGVFIFISGKILLVAGLIRLGKNLTPMPHPKKQSTLIVSGPYQYVRHPIYGGGFFIAIGWALLVHSWLTLGYALILFVFLDIKSRREEQWLMEKFPEYKDYQKRVKKLVPWVY